MYSNRGASSGNFEGQTADWHGYYGHEGFRLDFDMKTIKIPSCMGIEIPIALHAKPHHAAQRAVFAAESTTIPPRSIVRVPARLQASLPDDRDYVFEGRHRQGALYSHLVEANCGG
ncbi:hypothetical protein N7501_004394 [Penicillium viridicatum]|nr:hypothetical protein N7501_004394 [Penicillium viridicatum]